MRVRVRRGEEGIGRGWASFHAAGTGKNSRDKSRARLPAPERHLHPLQTIPWMEGEGGGEKKWGRKSGRNNLEETFPGLLRISFLFPHSLPPFRCFLRNHCPPTPFPPVFHTLFIFVTIKKNLPFPDIIFVRFFIHLCFIN